MNHDGNLPDSATIDHVIPLSASGIRCWGNEVAACQKCNGLRSSQPADDESSAIAQAFIDAELMKRARERERFALKKVRASCVWLAEARRSLPVAPGEEPVLALLAVAERALREAEQMLRPAEPNADRGPQR